MTPPCLFPPPSLSCFRPPVLRHPRARFSPRATRQITSHQCGCFFRGSIGGEELHLLAMGSFGLFADSPNVHTIYHSILSQAGTSEERFGSGASPRFPLIFFALLAPAVLVLTCCLLLHRADPWTSPISSGPSSRTPTLWTRRWATSRSTRACWRTRKSTALWLCATAFTGARRPSLDISFRLLPREEKEKKGTPCPRPGGTPTMRWQRPASCCWWTRRTRGPSTSFSTTTASTTLWTSAAVSWTAFLLPRPLILISSLSSFLFSCPFFSFVLSSSLSLSSPQPCSLSLSVSSLSRFDISSVSSSPSFVRLSFSLPSFFFAQALCRLKKWQAVASLCASLSLSSSFLLSFQRKKHETPHSPRGARPRGASHQGPPGLPGGAGRAGEPDSASSLFPIFLAPRLPTGPFPPPSLQFFYEKMKEHLHQNKD